MWYGNVNTKSIIQIDSSDERTSTSADIRFKDFLVIGFDCLPVLKRFILSKSDSCLRFVTKGVLKIWFAGGSRGVRQWENLQSENKIKFAGGSRDSALSRRFWKKTTVWKYQKYVGDTKFHKLFDSKKICGARALRIFYHLCQKIMIFEFSQRYETQRAPRAEVRARQKCF